MAFRYIVTDPAGAAIGELRNASNRKVSLGVTRNPTASATLRLDNPLADRILSGATLIKIYETGIPFAAPSLRFVGDVAAVEEVGPGDGSGGSVNVTFGGPLTRLFERLLGKTAAGYANGGPLATKDKSVLVGDLVTAANGEGYTGVDLASVTNVGSSSYVMYAPLKNALEAITELVNSGSDAPEFEVIPSEPTAVSGGTRIATINVKPAVGQARPAAVFEYGVGRRNVIEYKRQVSYAVGNAAYSPPSASNPGGAILSSGDATSIGLYRRREVLASVDIPVDALRQRYLDELVRIRKNPRQIITFTPARDDVSKPGRVPRFGVDYFLGDAVPFRAVTKNAQGQDVVRVNGSLRVYGIEWSIDELGAATPSLTLTAD